MGPEWLKNNNGDDKYEQKCRNENKMQQKLEEIIHF
jgi:hypothetical protein